MTQGAQPSPDYSGYLQIGVGPLQVRPTSTFYAQLYGCMLYYWTERPRAAEVAPIAKINLDGAHLRDLTTSRLSWVVEGPEVKKPVTFTAPAEREKKEWKAKMQALVMPNTVHLTTQAPTEENGATVIYSSEPHRRVSLEDFRRVVVLGNGAFGEVLLVEKKDTGKRYAMKVMEKAKLSLGLNLRELPVERSILEMVRHPFIVRLHYAFQTDAYLYIVLDFLAGGELFFHLGREPFDEYRAKFYTAEIALAIGYLHSKDIIYRDLKPENVVLDKNGHACLTDFGLAKPNIGIGDTTSTYCGTPEYQAPEFLLGDRHGRAVDWWSLGIMLYEMLLGIPPFYDEEQNTHVVYELILEGELNYTQNGRTVSQEAKDLLERLLDRNPETRLQDVETLKKHPFFAGIDFGKLYRRELEPPFKPDPDVLNNFDQEFTSQPIRHEEGTFNPDGPQVVGFTYNADDESVEIPSLRPSRSNNNNASTKECTASCSPPPARRRSSHTHSNFASSCFHATGTSLSQASVSVASSDGAKSSSPSSRAPHLLPKVTVKPPSSSLPKSKPSV